MDKIIIRSLTTEDLSFAAELMRTQKWFALTQRELENTIADPACYCLLAEKDNIKCGLVLSRVTGGNGMIANLIVSPAQRNQGIGKILFQSILDHLLAMNAQRITLNSGLKWLSFFEAFGFSKQQRIFSFFGDVEPRLHPQVAHVQTGDLAELYRLDHDYYPGDRGHFLSHFFETYPNLALKFTKGDRITAYLFGQVGLGGFVFAGPLVANNASYYDVRALLQNFQEIIGFQPFHLSTVEKQSKLLPVLVELGMKPDPENLYLMIRETIQPTNEQPFLILRGQDLIA